MNPIIADIFKYFLYALMFAVIARSILSWLPISIGHPVAVFIRFLSDPLIDPVRRLMPRMGTFDFSPVVVIIVLILMVNIVDRLRS